MNIEKNDAKPKWYSLPRWRSTGPGGYYGGFFSGIGLGLMLLALAVMEDFIQPSWDTVFLAGTVIFTSSTFVCCFIEGTHSKKNDKANT